MNLLASSTTLKLMPKHSLPKVTDLTDLEGKYVLLRGSLNVPVQDGRVVNQFRIARALPTIDFLVKAGARVILVGHIGREQTETLTPVLDVLKEKYQVIFSPDITGQNVREKREALKNGEILMLENLRQDLREKENDQNFAIDLAGLAEIYVNDAFEASHREHASLVGVPKHLPSYFGINFIQEYEELSKVMQPQPPSLFILGGAKFDTKMPLVKEYIKHYDHVCVAGALANDIYKARGFEVGTSLVSKIDLSGDSLLENSKLSVPVEVVVSGPAGERVCLASAVSSEEKILDAGPAFIETLRPLVAEAKTILWNGPLGNYEAGYAKQTEALAKIIAESGAYSVLGGGDTIAAIESIGCQDKFGFLSTAGGAMLTFMEKGTLPAIDAVLDK